MFECICGKCLMNPHQCQVNKTFLFNDGRNGVHATTMCRVCLEYKNQHRCRKNYKLSHNSISLRDKQFIIQNQPEEYNPQVDLNFLAGLFKYFWSVKSYPLEYPSISNLILNEILKKPIGKRYKVDRKIFQEKTLTTFSAQQMLHSFASAIQQIFANRQYIYYEDLSNLDLSALHSFDVPIGLLYEALGQISRNCIFIDQQLVVKIPMCERLSVFQRNVQDAELFKIFGKYLNKRATICQLIAYCGKQICALLKYFQCTSSYVRVDIQKMQKIRQAHIISAWKFCQAVDQIELDMSPQQIQVCKARLLQKAQIFMKITRIKKRPNGWRKRIQVFEPFVHIQKIKPIYGQFLPYPSLRAFQNLKLLQQIKLHHFAGIRNMTIQQVQKRSPVKFRKIINKYPSIFIFNQQRTRFSMNPNFSQWQVIMHYQNATLEECYAYLFLSSTSRQSFAKLFRKFDPIGQINWDIYQKLSHIKTYNQQTEAQNAKKRQQYLKQQPQNDYFKFRQWQILFPVDYRKNRRKRFQHACQSFTQGYQIHLLPQRQLTYPDFRYYKYYWLKDYWSQVGQQLIQLMKTANMDEKIGQIACDCIKRKMNSVESTYFQKGFRDYVMKKHHYFIDQKRYLMFVRLDVLPLEDIFAHKKEVMIKFRLSQWNELNTQMKIQLLRLWHPNQLYKRIALDAVLIIHTNRPPEVVANQLLDNVIQDFNEKQKIYNEQIKDKKVLIQLDDIELAPQIVYYDYEMPRQYKNRKNKTLVMWKDIESDAGPFQFDMSFYRFARILFSMRRKYPKYIPALQLMRKFESESYFDKQSYESIPREVYLSCLIVAMSSLFSSERLYFYKDFYFYINVQQYDIIEAELCKQQQNPSLTLQVKWQMKIRRNILQLQSLKDTLFKMKHFGFKCYAVPSDLKFWQIVPKQQRFLQKKAYFWNPIVKLQTINDIYLAQKQDYKIFEYFKIEEFFTNVKMVRSDYSYHIQIFNLPQQLAWSQEVLSHDKRFQDYVRITIRNFAYPCIHFGSLNMMKNAIKEQPCSCRRFDEQDELVICKNGKPYWCYNYEWSDPELNDFHWMKQGSKVPSLQAQRNDHIFVQLLEEKVAKHHLTRLANQIKQIQDRQIKEQNIFNLKIISHANQIEQIQEEAQKQIEILQISSSPQIQEISPDKKRQQIILVDDVIEVKFDRKDIISIEDDGKFDNSNGLGEDQVQNSINLTRNIDENMKSEDVISNKAICQSIIDQDIDLNEIVFDDFDFGKNMQIIKTTTKQDWNCQLHFTQPKCYRCGYKLEFFTDLRYSMCSNKTCQQNKITRMNFPTKFVVARMEKFDFIKPPIDSGFKKIQIHAKAKKNNIYQSIRTIMPESQITEEIMFGGRIFNQIIYPHMEQLDQKSCQAIDYAIQNAERIPIQIKKTDKKGYGVFATANINQNSVLCVYTGEALFQQCLTEEYYQNDSVVLIGWISGRQLLMIPKKYVNVGRFFNSVIDKQKPNLVCSWCLCKGKLRFAMVTSMKIAKGQQICWDYGSLYGLKQKITKNKCGENEQKCQKKLSALKNDFVEIWLNSEKVKQMKGQPELFPCASIIKLLTCITAYQLAEMMGINLDQQIVIQTDTPKESEQTNFGISKGECYKIVDLLLIILSASACDVSTEIARYFGDNLLIDAGVNLRDQNLCVSAFITKMHQVSQSIGMQCEVRDEKGIDSTLLRNQDAILLIQHFEKIPQLSSILKTKAHKIIMKSRLGFASTKIVYPTNQIIFGKTGFSTTFYSSFVGSIPISPENTIYVVIRGNFNKKVLTSHINETSNYVKLRKGIFKEMKFEKRGIMVGELSLKLNKNLLDHIVQRRKNVVKIENK